MGASTVSSTDSPAVSRLTRAVHRYRWELGLLLGTLYLTLTLLIVFRCLDRWRPAVHIHGVHWDPSAATRDWMELHGTDWQCRQADPWSPFWYPCTRDGTSGWLYTHDDSYAWVDRVS